MLSRELWESAATLERFLRSKQFPFCFIGGMALQRWGEPRMTRDLDITLLTGFGTEASFIDAVLAEYQPRIEDAASFAKLNRILLLVDRYGTPIDVSLGAMPFEERTIQRASLFHGAHDANITTCSAEDLIVHKAFANREQDWIDIRSIIVRTPDINQELLFAELEPLAALKEEPSITARLRELVDSRQ